MGSHRPVNWRAFQTTTGRTAAIDQDTEHLRLLSIFHYVVAGLLGLVGCFPTIHLAIGIAIVTGAFAGGDAPPPEFGWFFIAIAVFVMATSWITAIAVAIAGRKLAARTAYTYCLVVAVIECLFMPFGTVLGVFTILVLNRPSVKQSFGIVPNADAVA